jgi:hypothetical protein
MVLKVALGVCCCFFPQETSIAEATNATAKTIFPFNFIVVSFYEFIVMLFLQK